MGFDKLHRHNLLF